MQTNNPTKQQILSGNRFRPAEYTPKPVMVKRDRQPSNTVMKTALLLFAILTIFTIYHITVR